MISKVNSLFNSITYRLGSTIIDPGDVQDWAGVNHVLLTHTHFDHIYGLNDLWNTNHRIRVYTNLFGHNALLDSRLNLSKYYGDPFIFSHPNNIVVVNDNETVALGDGSTAQAVFTPGHNDSCITWIIDNQLFTGDAYIPGTKVVTNLPGADRKTAMESISQILKLAEERTICPGHKV